MNHIDATESGALATGTEQLWRDHYDALRRLCAVVVGPHDADDLATDTFLRCREALLSGHVANPGAYLLRSATNLAHNSRRGRQREQRRNERVPTPELSEPSDELGHVRDAIRALSARQRAVLYLIYWDDLTEADAADVLGLHLGTVRRHVHRAHEQLRKVLP